MLFRVLVAAFCLALGTAYLSSSRSSSNSRRKIAALAAVPKKQQSPQAQAKAPVAEAEAKKSGFGIANLLQLMAMGAGAPMLGEFEKFEDNKAIFKLEANNLVDSEGNVIQTRAKFFENGWVEDGADSIKPPGFFANLVSGGKLQEEWDNKNRKPSKPTK